MGVTCIYSQGRLHQLPSSGLIRAFTASMVGFGSRFVILGHQQSMSVAMLAVLLVIQTKRFYWVLENHQDRCLVIDSLDIGCLVACRCWEALPRSSTLVSRLMGER